MVAVSANYFIWAPVTVRREALRCNPWRRDIFKYAD